MKISLDLIDLPEIDLRASVDEDALDELAASLRDHGQLQPIGVIETNGNRYEVVFGARRTRAARLNEWTEIEANVLPDRTDSQNDAAKLIENVQRLEMSPMEEAYGLAQLIGEGEIDIRKLQRQTGKGRSWITTRLDLMAMPTDLQSAVQNGLVSIGVAKAFSEIDNDEIRMQYIKLAHENGCTADQARVWAGQAEFAASGMRTMDEIMQHSADSVGQAQIVDQQYHCFVCGDLHSWRRVNTLVLCGGCQDAIATARTPHQPDGMPSPLDTDEMPVA